MILLPHHISSLCECVPRSNGSPFAFGEPWAQCSCLSITSHPQIGCKSQGYHLGRVAPKFQTPLCPEKGLQSPRHPALLPSWILISSPSRVPDQRPSNILLQQDLQIPSAHSWHPPPRPCHHGNLLSLPAAPSAGIYSSLPIGLLAALLPPSLFSCSS